MFQAVCFDFDYTLGDCTESIIAGFRHGLTALGWPEPDREAVRATIGYLLLLVPLIRLSRYLEVRMSTVRQAC